MDHLLPWGSGEVSKARSITTYDKIQKIFEIRLSYHF